MKPARPIIAVALAALLASAAFGQQPPPSLTPPPFGGEAPTTPPNVPYILPEAPTSPAVMPSESFDLGNPTPNGGAGQFSQYGAPTNVPGGMAPYAYPQAAGADNSMATNVFNSYGGGGFENYSPEVPPMNRLYVTPEAWLMHRNDATWRDIAVFAGTSSSLFRTSDPDFGNELIPKLTAGYAWTDWAVEGTVIYKDDIDAHSDGTLTNGMNGVFFGLQGAGSDWTNASNMRLDLATGLHSYEVNAVRYGSYATWLFGMRYMEIRDRLSVLTTKTAVSDGSIGTYNKLLGAQIGGRIGYDFTSITFEGTAKAGMYYASGNVSTFIRDNGNTTIVRNVRAGGQNEAYEFELAASAAYRPWTAVLLRAGYQMMYIENIALAADQIDQRTDATNMTGGSKNAHGNLWMVGPFAGAEIRW